MNKMRRKRPKMNFQPKQLTHKLWAINAHEVCPCLSYLIVESTTKCQKRLDIYNHKAICN